MVEKLKAKMASLVKEEEGYRKEIEAIEAKIAKVQEKKAVVVELIDEESGTAPVTGTHYRPVNPTNGNGFVL